MQTDEVEVKIKYLATLREKSGVREECVSFPPGSTLSSVARWIQDTHGLSVPSSRIMTILNGRGWGQLSDGIETQLRNGDTICLFPPISGG